MTADRLAPLTGVLFILLAIAGFVIGGEPKDASHPVQEIVNHYQDNKDSIQIGAAIVAAAGVALVFFGGYLRKVFRAAEGEGGVLSAVVLIGTAVVAVGAAIDSTIAFAIADRVDDIEPNSVQALQALWDGDFLPIAMGTEIFLLSAGISVVRHGALPKWLGWVAIVLGLVGLTPIGFAAFVGSALWILVVSILLTIRAGRETAPATP